MQADAGLPSPERSGADPEQASGIRCRGPSPSPVNEAPCGTSALQLVTVNDMQWHVCCRAFFRHILLHDSNILLPDWW